MAVVNYYFGYSEFLGFIDFFERRVFGGVFLKEVVFSSIFPEEGVWQSFFKGGCFSSIFPEEGVWKCCFLKGDAFSSIFPEEGVWQWSNGDPWSFTNWHEGEPNNVDNEV